MARKQVCIKLLIPGRGQLVPDAEAQELQGTGCPRPASIPRQRQGVSRVVTNAATGSLESSETHFTEFHHPGPVVHLEEH